MTGEPLHDLGLHLFIDDAEVQDHPGFTRQVQQPARLPEPVLRGDAPWEGEAVQLWGSVIYDAQEELFKMWYYSVNTELYERDGIGHYMCYATSRDGVTWDKPALGLVPCGGSRANNIVFPTPDIPRDYGIDPWGIIKDANEQDPAKRYKMGFYQQRPPTGAVPGGRGDVAGQIAFFTRLADCHGMYSACSADGIHWRMNEALCVPRAGDAGVVVSDPLRGGYIVTSRRHNTLMDHFALQWKQYRRVIALATSRDFERWTSLETVLKPDDFDDGRDQMYTMTPFACGNQYLGFLGLYRTDMEVGQVELASARDLGRWQRVGRREPFLAVGPPGSWDSGWATCAASPPVLKDDQLYIWYSGRSQAHGTGGRFRSAIGLARLRRDGFVALRCGIRGGDLMTEPIRVEGRRLVLNAACPFGSLKVRVVADVQVPQGFSFEECHGLERGDHTAFKITWGEAGRDLSAFVGQDVRLHFRADNAAALYSYRTALG